MTKLCQNCARQFLCENYKKLDDCKEFLSFLYTKDYGEVIRLLEKLEKENGEIENESI